MPFRKGSKAPDGANGRPTTGGRPEGGYGSAGAPAKAQKMSAQKGKPQGGGKGKAALKPAGGFGTHGKPYTKKQLMSESRQSNRDYAGDNMSCLDAKVPTDKRKLFNMPRGNFKGGA